MVFIKVALILAFACTCIQDIKERKIYWFLPLLIGGLSGLLFYYNTLPELFLSSVILNLGLMLILLITLNFYIKLRLKTTLFNAIGQGDILMFVVLTFACSTTSFIVLFVGSLVFSLTVHLYVVRTRKAQLTVPLAGYMSLFFLGAYLIQWYSPNFNMYLF